MITVVIGKNFPVVWVPDLDTGESKVLVLSHADAREHRLAGLHAPLRIVAYDVDPDDTELREIIFNAASHYKSQVVFE